MVIVDKNTISLIKKGVSLNKISELTGLRKSTLYFHYQKTKGKKFLPLKFNFANRNDLGEFIGIFTGDGSFYKDKTYHYTIRIFVGYYERHYAEYLQKRFMKWFDKKPNIYLTYHNGKESMITLSYYSKGLYELIKRYLDWKNKKTYTIKLKKLDLKDKKFNFGFLKGLIDTDGNFYAPKRRLSFSTVSKDLADQVFLMINHILGDQPNLNIIKKEYRSNLYTITLHGEKARRLIRIIKPSNINKNTRQ